MRILSKISILIFFLFLISHFSFFISPAFAQTKNQTPIPTNTTSDVPNNPHYSTQSTVIEIMSAITCQLSGIDPINPKQSCLGIDSASGKIGFLPSPQTGGAIGFMGNMIATLYTPPLHTGDYFQNLASSFGITKKTYAQTTGTGFEGLKPLLNLWTAFRNIAYLVFVIVFIVIGLAIMLRIKIDPRTVMTIQNQIPKIIIGILLVTFSYAIAGFLIDMMYTSIYLVGNIITSSDSKNTSNSGAVQNITSASNPFRAIGVLMDKNSIVALPNLAWKPTEAVSEPIAELFDNPPGKIITGIAGYVLGTQAKKIAVEAGKGIAGLAKGAAVFLGLAAAPVTGGASVAAVVPATFAIDAINQIFAALVGGAGFFFAKDIAGFVISIIVFLVLLIALLVALFRLWLTLLMAYIHILLDVVFAPFWIIGGIVPGSPINISGWFRDIIANLAAFPATIAMFLLGKVFIYAFTNGDKVNNFVPPLIGNRIESETLGAIIGLGIILMTPNVVNMLKTALKAPKVDTGLGKSIGAGNPLSAFSKAGQIGLAYSGLKGLPIVGKFLNKTGGAGTTSP